MKNYFFCGLLCLFALSTNGQPTIARKWNEAILQSIREDFARPPIAARTLFYTSMAMYEAWAAYDTTGQAKPYLLGKTILGHDFAYNGIPAPQDIAAARREALCYAVYRVARQKVFFSPSGFSAFIRYDTLMAQAGYNPANQSLDYESGSPAALGNLIGQYINILCYLDGANEINNYATQYYAPVNPPLIMDMPGNPDMPFPSRWQPLYITGAVDQNGNPIPALQQFQSPEWGNVRPFALKDSDKTMYERDGHAFPVYLDPGAPPMLNLTHPDDSVAHFFKWCHSMVSAWGSHHDPDDGVMWDISPGGMGNAPNYPQHPDEYADFYDFDEGGDHSAGYDINPYTNAPYAPQWVPRGDYTRVISQYWADGPQSETPPGHWFVMFNQKVNDHPALQRRFGGQGPLLDDLEWDVKAYFLLGGAVHDAAITAWGIKGWYDAVRPVSTLRYMAGLGQSSDPALPSYHPGGVELIPGYVELVPPGDPLAGPNNEHAGKIKMFTWKGHSEITFPWLDVAGAGWILAENWDTYQKKTFVTPPFGGYISGHSTYSRAAAEALTLLTGDAFFPGGMAETLIHANSGFLVFERGPGVDVRLQWATYRDASDQSALSRIWGGIHPPFDDIPGRMAGKKCGESAFELARSLYYTDADGDGYWSYQDCNDHDPLISPNGWETGGDGVDNNCDGIVDNVSSVGNLAGDIRFQIFPNPARDWLNIQLTTPAPVAVRLEDMMGKTIFQTTGNTDQVRLFCGHYPAGGYRLSLTNPHTGQQKNTLIQIIP